MLLVTFHGSGPDGRPLGNNVRAYDKDGREVSRKVLEEPVGVQLDELRGIYRIGKLLYVAVSNNTQNSVLCYEGSDASYSFSSIFVSGKVSKGIVHPFDFAFDDQGFCYLSSQDTNLVTRLKVSSDGRGGTPAPIAPALPADGHLLPGTFVASSVANLCKLPTTAVPLPAGLDYSDDGKKKHSVRGVAWINGALYVVDQPAGRVKIYDPDGKLLGQSNKVETPVHLLAHGGNLFVSGGNDVLTAPVPKRAGDFTLAEIPHLHVKNGGAMAFTDEGHLYIASRTENVILKFDSDFHPVKFDCDLPDNPEFLLHV